MTTELEQAIAAAEELRYVLGIRYRERINLILRALNRVIAENDEPVTRSRGTWCSRDGCPHRESDTTPPGVFGETRLQAGEICDICGAG